MPLSFARLDKIPKQSRVRLTLRGDDVGRFLQGTLSADVEELDEARAVAAALLTVKGKIVAEVVVVPAEGGADLLVPQDVAAAVAEMLDKHIIMDDVEVETDDATVCALVWGDGELPSLPGGVRSFSTRHPAPGTLLLGPPEAIGGVAASIPEVGPDEFTAHRIATASPGWQHELTPDRFPPEVGFVYAVSYDKGCFMGQEPLARIHAKGRVNWVMVAVALSESVPVPAALSHPEREGAGTLTSAGGETGLAIVRRRFAEEGVALRSPTGAVATITSGPLGDDPGTPGRR